MKFQDLFNGGIIVDASVAGFQILGQSTFIDQAAEPQILFFIASLRFLTLQQVLKGILAVIIFVGRRIRLLQHLRWGYSVALYFATALYGKLRLCYRYRNGCISQLKRRLYSNVPGLPLLSTHLFHQDTA